MAQFKDDVHILAILEEVVEADNVFMEHRSVYFDLRHQFLFSPRFSECGLGDHFGRVEVLVILHLVALSESALPQELPLDVALLLIVYHFHFNC